jgi:hypothetical protein
VAGTIFWMRFDVVARVLLGNDDVDAVDLIDTAILPPFEAGFVKDGRRETVTHAWERAFGILVASVGAVTVGTVALQARSLDWVLAQHAPTCATRPVAFVRYTGRTTAALRLVERLRRDGYAGVWVVVEHRRSIVDDRLRRAVTGVVVARRPLAAAVDRCSLASTLPARLALVSDALADRDVVRLRPPAGVDVWTRRYCWSSDRRHLKLDQGLLLFTERGVAVLRHYAATARRVSTTDLLTALVQLGVAVSTASVVASADSDSAAA